MNAVTTRPQSTSQQTPEPMTRALEASLARALSAVEDDGRLSAVTLPSEARDALMVRRDRLRSAMAPTGPARTAAILATLSGMSYRGEPEQKMVTFLAKQDVTDLCTLPEWALERACQAYRLAEIGDGHWRPTAGELRTYVLRKCEPWHVELEKLRRVLTAPRLDAPRSPPATPEQRAKMRSMFEQLKAKMAGIA